MLARDLTDDDIGHVFWCIVTLHSGEGWRRIVFEGLTKPPAEDAHWVLARCSPSVPGSINLIGMDRRRFSAVLLRADSEVWPVEVDYAVTIDGQIVETGERAG